MTESLTKKELEQLRKYQDRSVNVVIVVGIIFCSMFILIPWEYNIIQNPQNEIVRIVLKQLWYYSIIINTVIYFLLGINRHDPGNFSLMAIVFLGPIQTISASIQYLLDIVYPIPLGDNNEHK